MGITKGGKYGVRLGGQVRANARWREKGERERQRDR